MENSNIPPYTSEKELNHKNYLPHILIVAAVLVISGIWFANYIFKQNSEKSHAAEALPQTTTPIFQYFKLQPNDGVSSTIEKTQTAISPTISPTPVTVKPEALSVVYPPLTGNSVRVIVKKSNSTSSVIEKIEAFHKDGTVIATHSYNQAVAMNQAAYSEDIPCNSNEDVQINTHVLNNNRETVYLTNTQCGKEDTVSVVDANVAKEHAIGNKAESSQTPTEVGVVKIYNDNIYPSIHWTLDADQQDVVEYDYSYTACLPLPPLFPDKLTVTYPHGDGMTYYFLRGDCAVGFDVRVSSPNYPEPTATPGPILSAPTLRCGAYDSAHNTFTVSVGWTPSDLVAHYVYIDGPNENLYYNDGDLHSPQTAPNIPADIGLDAYYWDGGESPHTHIVCPKPPADTPTPPINRPTINCGSYQGNGLFSIRMDWTGDAATKIIVRYSGVDHSSNGYLPSPENIPNIPGNGAIQAQYERNARRSDWSNIINCQIPFQSPTPTAAPIVTLRSSITNPSNNSSGITVTHMYYEASGVAHALDINHPIAKGESWTAPTYNAACDSSNTFNVGVTYTIDGQTETANSSNINCGVVAHVNVPVEDASPTPLPPTATPTSLPGATATPRPPTSTPRPPTPTPWRFYRCSTGSNCTLVFQSQCRGDDRYCGSDQATCNSICGQPAASNTPVPPVSTATPRPPTATPTPTIVYTPLNLYFSNQNVAPWLRVTSIVYYDQVARTTHTEHPNIQIASGTSSNMPTIQCNSLNGNYSSILVEYLLPNNAQQYVAVNVQCGGVNNGHLFNQANTGYPPAVTPTPHPTRPPQQCQSPQTIQTGCGPYGDGYQSCTFSSQGGSCHRVSCGVCYF